MKERKYILNAHKHIIKQLHLYSNTLIKMCVLSFMYKPFSFSLNLAFKSKISVLKTLSGKVGLKEPGPKVESNPGYQFYGLGQAFGLLLIGNEGPFCF